MNTTLVGSISNETRLLIYSLCVGMPGAVGSWLISEVMKASGKLCDSIFSGEKDEEVGECPRKYLCEVKTKKRCLIIKKLMIRKGH